MFSETISAELSARIEAGEVNAWLDMYAAAPSDFARKFQLEIMQVGSIVLTRCKPIPFVHFNCVMNLGMTEPASERQVDELLALYRDAGVSSFAFFHIPHFRPAALLEWYKARNLRAAGGWDRIYRDNKPMASAADRPPDGFRVEEVTKATGPEWAAYIDAIYGLPTTPWLLALVERPGWHHYVLRQDERIVAVRSMYIDRDGTAWFGIDAPIPGIMAPTFDLDVQLCRAMVSDGLKWGAKYFVADIEAPAAAMDTPAYRHFEALGFKRPYFRAHYAPKAAD